VARAAAARIASDATIDPKRKNELESQIVAAINKASSDATIKAEAKASPAKDEFEKLDVTVRAQMENELK
jgi:hypothetical protein